MKCFLITIALIMTSCSHPQRNLAGENKIQKDDIDAIVLPLIQEKRNVGIVVGLIKDGEKKVYGYGKTNINSGNLPDGNTIFSIGSITKVFTNLLLSKAIADRILNWEDLIKDKLPQEYSIPKYADREIKFIDLATHTSGLPRIPDNINLQGLNPYKDYSADMMFTFLKGHTLKVRPGEKYDYSNLGAGLLGHALSHVYDTSYEDLVIKEITKEMGLTDTKITLNDEQKQRYAKGYYREDNGNLTEVPYWEFDVLAPCGAFRSTANDMLKFLEYNLGYVDAQNFQDAIASMRDFHIDTETPSLKITRGWHLYDIEGKGKIYWHNGGTYGFKNIIAFNLEKKVGVVVLSNTFELQSKVDEAGLKILGNLMNHW